MRGATLKKNMGDSALGKKQKKRETVTRVIDGDTIETSRRTIPVRLENVNAPEKGRSGEVEIHPKPSVEIWKAVPEYPTL